MIIPDAYQASAANPVDGQPQSMATLCLVHVKQQLWNWLSHIIAPYVVTHACGAVGYGTGQPKNHEQHSPNT